MRRWRLFFFSSTMNDWACAALRAQTEICWYKRKTKEKSMVFGTAAIVLCGLQISVSYVIGQLLMATLACQNKNKTTENKLNKTKSTINFIHQFEIFSLLQNFVTNCLPRIRMPANLCGSVCVCVWISDSTSAFMADGRTISIDKTKKVFFSSYSPNTGVIYFWSSVCLSF